MRPQSREAAVYSFDYPPNDGGIARLCAEIVTGLSTRSEVAVLSQRREGDSDVPDVPETRVTPRRPLRELAAWWALIRNRCSGPLVTGTWYPEGLIALLAGRRDVVILAHGAELTPPDQRWRRPLWSRLQRWTLEDARLVVANSHYTAGLVSASAPRAKVAAIPLAVDHVRFSPGDRDAARARFGIHDPATTVIGTVTRVQAFKGIDIVLRAIAALPSHHQQQVVYLVGGKGPAIDDLQQLAHELGIEHQVRWLGFVPEVDLPDLYRAMDLFTLCTRELLDQRSVEGFGMVFLEAQSCGTPAVGTRTGGIPDAVRDGEGGWLIAQDDVPALAGILGELVEQPERFAEQGRRARARVEREATWEHYMDRFEAALRAGGRHG
jgi:phosphatidylinositol alpha-1,6-mannosyltransferase